jgi:hypothetical protein
VKGGVGIGVAPVADRGDGAEFGLGGGGFAEADEKRGPVAAQIESRRVVGAEAGGGGSAGGVEKGAGLGVATGVGAGEAEGGLEGFDGVEVGGGGGGAARRGSRREMASAKSRSTSRTRRRANSVRVASAAAEKSAGARAARVVRRRLSRATVVSRAGVVRMRSPAFSAGAAGPGWQ